MKKVRSNASWNRLTEEQREQLEEWLFDERISYRDAQQRAAERWQFVVSFSSIRRFYERAAQERLLLGIADSARRLKAIQKSPATETELKQAAMKIIGHHVLRQVTTAPDDPKQWEPLVRLLLRSESNVNQCRGKTEANAINRKKMELSYRKYHFNMIEEASQWLPELKEYEEIRRDPTISVYEEYNRLNEIRLKIFGPHPDAPLPECADDEKAMIKSWETECNEPPPDDGKPQPS